jgi:hypothetical protein
MKRLSFSVLLLVGLACAGGMAQDVAKDSVKSEQKKNQDAEIVFLQYSAKTNEGKEYFKTLAGTNTDAARIGRQRIGRLLIVAQTETPKLVKENQKEGVVTEAQETIELWSLRYLRNGEKAEGFMKKVLTGFPDKDGQVTAPVDALIKGAKHILSKPMDPNSKEHGCFTGDENSDC